ncbi:MAG: ParB N-terminal domain-containing protein [Chlamydiales bacterium]
MKQQEKFETALVDIKKIKPVDYNPRDITDDSYEGLKNSIKEFGMVEPFIVNKVTGNLMGGHQRLRAAQELKFKKVPVVYVNVSNVKEKVLNITLNNPKIRGYFTSDLQKVLDTIKFDLPNFDMEAMRFDGLNAFIMNKEWNSNFTAVEKAGENLDGITAKIIVTCPQEMKEEIVSFLNEKITEADFEDVNVK